MDSGEMCLKIHIRHHIEFISIFLKSWTSIRHHIVNQTSTKTMQPSVFHTFSIVFKLWCISNHHEIPPLLKAPMKCSSHGQSQMVKAVMPLHKTMEYETFPVEVSPVKVQRQWASIYDSYLRNIQTQFVCSLKIYETSSHKSPINRI